MISPFPPAPTEHLEWLGNVQEVRHPLSQSHPIWVRSSVVAAGAPVPQPSVPSPEQHPYCEVAFVREGRGWQYIGSEKLERNSGDIILLGPGLPHYGMHLDWPQRHSVVYFLPTVVFEMGPEGDGARVLERFTLPQPIRRRILRPPLELRAKLEAVFDDLQNEFDGSAVCREFRLRSLLAEILSSILRWDDRFHRDTATDRQAVNWVQIEKALRYIQEHYTEAIYVQDVARAAGLGASRLQTMFREALGISCMQYLLSFRVSHAAASLCQPGARVADVAMATGFDALSNFNTAFRRAMGMSPTEYIRRRQHGA
ncbi:MAG TPA: AraC family transcriptional regulator [Opitutus sp.]|nr:AraC family transcriptional regulator [Opitutus sp.]